MKSLTVVALAAMLGVSAAEVHPDRQKMIDEINSMPGNTWKAGVNPRFAHMAPGASKKLCGVKEESHNHLQQMVAEGKASIFEKNPEFTVPTSFDSAAHWPQCAKTIADIRDQSDCGCCWAFGAAEAASDRMCIATNASILVPLSAQNMCFCASWAGCDGGQLGQAWDYIQSSGLVTGGQNKGIGPFGNGYCSEFSLPHCHHHGPVGHGGDPYPSEGSAGCPSVSTSPSCPTKCDADAKSPHNDFSSDKYSFKGQIQTMPSDADAIAQAIMQGGPVECAFTVYSDFENYVSGIYKHTSGTMLGGHAVKIVGWGEEGGVKYWKVANSWNPYWGEKGYFRIVRGTNECGIEDDVVAAVASAKWGKMA